MMAINILALLFLLASIMFNGYENASFMTISTVSTAKRSIASSIKEKANLVFFGPGGPDGGGGGPPGGPGGPGGAPGPGFGPGGPSGPYGGFHGGFQAGGYGFGPYGGPGWFGPGTGYYSPNTYYGPNGYGPGGGGVGMRRKPKRARPTGWSAMIDWSCFFHDIDNRFVAGLLVIVETIVAIAILIAIIVGLFVLIF